MRSSSVGRGFAISAWLLLGLLVLAGVVLVLLGIPRGAAGMAAKGICSAAFVAERPLQNLMADEVLPASPVLAAIGISVDKPGKMVSARFAGLFERRAAW